MAERKDRCHDCGVTVTRLIKEYNVHVSSASEKNYFIERFVTGLPSFSKKKNDTTSGLSRKDYKDVKPQPQGTQASSSSLYPPTSPQAFKYAGCWNY
uniref:Transcription initiation factor IIF subunit alpha n=1 Tax=Tanacetum cinerariifolium TaxID=118510 RepID=A0A6L2NEA7_TANCI|nr:transcription initiation factor IIF subunit alpha [Tanacetum cinerariifolium]